MVAEMFESRQRRSSCINNYLPILSGSHSGAGNSVYNTTVLFPHTNGLIHMQLHFQPSLSTFLIQCISKRLMSHLPSLLLTHDILKPSLQLICIFIRDGFKLHFDAPDFRSFTTQTSALSLPINNAYKPGPKGSDPQASSS